MKNLQIGDNDLIGNKFNGHDLHLYLNKIGIESHHFIANPPMSKDNKTFQIGSDYSQHIRKLLIEAESYYNINGASHTLPFDIMYNKLFLEADVIHMHLIHNYMFNVNLLPLMTSLKPTVLTIHDPWMLTGHCTYFFDCQKWQNGCGDCPSLEIPFKISKDTTAFNWEMKRIAFQNSQLTLIVASKWMYNLVKQSPIFKDFDLHLIPFGINQDIFKYFAVKKAKKRLGIDEKSVTLMFRMQDNKFKGGDLLLQALPRLKDKNKITLITVGQNGLLDHLKGQFNILEYGWVTEDKKLAELYQACDIFLMPSKQEAFGMMAIEAMSARKPAIVLKGTSLPDVTKAPNIGIECERNSISLQRAIQNLIDNPKERENRAKLSYQHAIKEYNSEVYVKKIVEVYKTAIKNHQPSSTGNNVIKQLLKHNPTNQGNIAICNDKSCKMHPLNLSPLISKNHDANKFRIRIFKSITIFKRKVVKNKAKYYFLGIPILKVKQYK